MFLLKQSLKAFIKQRAVASFLVRAALKLHTFSCAVLRNLTPCLEPDQLHPKHRLMNYHQWFVKNLKADWSVLDIGCGNGALAYDLKSACREVVGIEQNQESVNYAQKKYFQEGMKYICADATKHVFEQRFDAIVLSNVLEHIEDRVGFLRSLYKNQDPGKPPFLFLRVPMLDRDWLPLYKRECGLEWRLDPTHYTEFMLEDLRHELAQAGLVVESHEIRFGEFYGVVKKT